MAITKTARTLLSSQSLAAGATITATELDLLTAPAAEVCVRITNGATPPTTAPTAIFFSGEASGVKRRRYIATGDLVANSVTDIPCSYGLRHMFANVTIVAGSTQGCTVEVFAQEATTL